MGKSFICLDLPLSTSYIRNFLAFSSYVREESLWIFISFLCNLLQFKNFPIHIQIGLIFFFSNVLYILFFRSINTPHPPPPPQPATSLFTFHWGILSHWSLQSCRALDWILSTCWYTPQSTFDDTFCPLRKKKSNFSVQFHSHLNFSTQIQIHSNLPWESL